MLHCVPYIAYLCCREEDQSDTDSTDSDCTWGTFGKFEYGNKGLPHALVHAPELVERGGHHLAFCTCTGEKGHKKYIKMAAKSARTYASHNLTERSMLYWVLWQILWSHVFKCIPQLKKNGRTDASLSEDSNGNEEAVMTQRLVLIYELRYTDGWAAIECPQNVTPRQWGATFLSKQVPITHDELLTLLRVKLDMEQTLGNTARLLKELRWECFGSCKIYQGEDGKMCRKFVGTSPPPSATRRDFVRLSGSEVDTAYAAQVSYYGTYMLLNTIYMWCRDVGLYMFVFITYMLQIIMFVRVSGFSSESGGIHLPSDLTNHPGQHDSVVLALVRWLSPHPNALIRDSKLRPICPPPFDTNHALWVFSKRPSPRRCFADTHLLSRQLHLFDGVDDITRRQNALKQEFAFYDLVQPESIECYELYNR